MNALAQLVLGDDTFTVEPLHLSITQKFTTGTTSNLHLVEDGDLSIKGHASSVVRSSVDGALVIGLGVDEDHDEIHYERTADTDAAEIIKRGIELLTLALAAVEQVTDR